MFRNYLKSAIRNIRKKKGYSFLNISGLAALLAWPIAYFAMNVWLRGFAYRTQINLRTFAVSALAALAIAFLTVSYQAVRAALADPVDSLKYE